MEIADRIDDYVKYNKEHIGNKKSPSKKAQRVNQTHDEVSGIHGAPTRVVTTEVTRQSSGPEAAVATQNQSYSQVLKDMDLEASRISEQITGHRVVETTIYEEK